MPERLARFFRAMELEERILHAGVFFCIAGLFFPWLSDNLQEWNGFGFHTGYVGHVLFLLQFILLSITFSPLLGGPIIVRKARRHYVRLLLSSVCTILLLASSTVLFRLTNEVHGAEVRFGMYVALIGSVLTTLYALLQHQENLRQQAQAVFHHPDQQVTKPKQQDMFPEENPPPPPPPPPPPLEDHTLFSSRP